MIEGRNLVWVSHLTRLYRCAPEHLRKLSADEAQGVSREDLQTFRLPDRSGTGVFQFRELSQQEPPPRTSITARSSNAIESEIIVGQAISPDNNTPNVNIPTPPLSIAQPDDEPSCPNGELSHPTTPHDPQKDLENAIETPIPDDTIS